MSEAGGESKLQLSDQEHNRLVLRVAELVGELEQAPDDSLRRQVQELLKCIDLIHREALFRLLAEVERSAPALLPRLLRDEVVQTLLLLYDFMPEPPRATAEAPDGFVPLSQLHPPVWVPIGRSVDFGEGLPAPREAEGRRLLICRLQGELRAVDNRCLDSILPLQMGRVENGRLVCPWHGCRYDLSTGSLEGTRRRLNVYPLKESDDGVVRVGLNLPDAGWEEKAPREKA